MISNCGHDERGKYTGGQAGDQTGQEWAVIPWYNRPWNVVLRHNDWKVREKIAELAKKAAENNHIGYDQGDRYTFWEDLKAVGYDPSKITRYCETDCSAGVAAIVKAVGYLLNVENLKNVSIYCYTGNLKAALKKAGFEVLNDQKYLTSDKYLLPGDVLLYEGHHTAINLDIGKEIIYLSDHWEKAENGVCRCHQKRAIVGPRTKRSDDNAVFQHERPEPCGKCVSGHCTGPVRRGRFVCSAELSAGGCPSDL